VLYALTCLWTIIAFHGRAEGSLLKHIIVPGLGLLANVAMLITIPWCGAFSAAAPPRQQESLLALGNRGPFWAVVSAVVRLSSPADEADVPMFATPNNSASPSSVATGNGPELDEIRR